MQHNIPHFNAHGISTQTVMILSINTVVTSVFTTLSNNTGLIISLLQVMVMLLSGGASAYVLYNQHRTRKWKDVKDREHEQEKQQHAERQKHIDSGGTI
jgi:hypothetical protein